VRAAGMGANLLLNVGPQPNGEIPAAALSRFKEIGEWMRANGETVYGTVAGPFPAQSWGTSTRKDDRLFLHVMTPETDAILLPADVKIKNAREFSTGRGLRVSRAGDHAVVHLDTIPDVTDYIVECAL